MNNELTYWHTVHPDMELNIKNFLRDDNHMQQKTQAPLNINSLKFPNV